MSARDAREGGWVDGWMGDWAVWVGGRGCGWGCDSRPGCPRMGAWVWACGPSPALASAEWSTRVGSRFAINRVGVGARAGHITMCEGGQGADTPWGPAA